MSFDLNIENYTKEELKNMFGLPETYDSSIVEIKQDGLINAVFSKPNVSNEMKEKIVDFLKKAKGIILSTTKIDKSLTDFYNSSYDLKSTVVRNEGGASFVQERAKKPYLSSYPSEFFPGTINPLKKKVNRQYVNIDTRFRENYYGSLSTNFHLNLPVKFNSVLTMQLTSIEIPKTFYNISKQLGNNFFWLRTSPPITNDVFVELPDGNYTTKSLPDFLNNYVGLLPVGNPLKNLVFVINFVGDTISGNTGSAQMCVGSTTGLIAFQLDFVSDRAGNLDYGTVLPLKMGWIMGYRNAIYTGSTTYVSEGVVDLFGPRYLYLVVDDFNNNVQNNFFSAFTSSVLNKNILARISLGNGFYGVYSENNLLVLTTPRQYYGPVDIQKMNIQLLDEYGRIVELNNMDYSFCLTFQSAYDI